MKKTRKQTALAKCVLATIMAMGMIGYTTVWAEDTVTPSPIDKAVSKDAAGHIYDASHNYTKGYFWTDLGHAQVQIGSGQQIELFTPFIYHTNNDQWKKGGTYWSPVHEGDNSEMECKESMSRITVGEFDRIIKSLYTNDITMAKTIYGEAGQAGLKDKVIKEVKATAGQGATVNTYKLVRENGTEVAVGIVDTDTKVVNNKLTFADGTLTSNITDNAGGVYTDSVDGIASQGWVNNKLENIVDTNTTNTGMEGSLDEYGKLTVKVKDSDQHSVQAEVEGIASRSWVTNQLEDIVDTNTITTVESATNMLKITDEGVEGNHAYKIDINGEQLGDFVQQYDTNTITTAQDDGKNYVTVNGGMDDNGNYNYTVGFNEDKLMQTIQENTIDTNTTNTGMEGSLDEYGKLTVKVKDSDQHSVQAEVEGIASRSWVTNQLEDIVDTNTITTVESATNMLKITDEGVEGNHAYKIDINGEQLGDFVQQYDTDTVTTAQDDGKGYVNVTEMIDDNGNYNYTVGINEDKLVETIQANDTNTITTAESGHAIITVNDSVGGGDLDDKNYVIGIDEDALKGFIQENTQDTNTITTAQDDGNGYVNVAEAVDADGNYNYTVGFDEGKLINTIKENDTNTVTTVADDGKGYVGVTDAMDADGNHNYTVAFDEGKLIETIQANDTNTVTTAQDDGNGYVNVAEAVDADGNYKYTVGFDEAKLINTIKENDTNTVTTVADDGKGYIGVTDAMDADGNHNYTVAFDEGKLIQTIEAKDKFVNGGSISADGKITLKVRNGEDVELEGQLKDAQLTEIERDKAAGTATLVVKDGYTDAEVRRLTIDDIASKAQNDKEHTEFREHFSELDHRVDSLGSRVDKVGAGAAALAALHPMDFDPDDKLTFAAGYGNYKGKNAAAVGAFYRPDEKVMLSVGGTFGNGENMVNAGISFSLDRTARVSNSRTAMAKEIVDLRANVANLTALVGQLTAGMGGTIEMDRMKLFPDVPENHWAYEYIGRLAAAGIVEGYPDGMFNGNRMMSRYEFAAMLYRALEKGVKLDHKLVREFEPEMGRIHVARISGADGDRGKIERVRVYGGDNRDHYGSKLK
ncbi:YadA-like family protein [Phascolarctobacterium succinatutens]|uniref:YadA-like family protein n=1 Tax=Phascolarctobacterium succinatutens TaxID=626940 RepID=UPI00307AE864